MRTYNAYAQTYVSAFVCLITDSHISIVISVRVYVFYVFYTVVSKYVQKA